MARGWKGNSEAHAAAARKGWERRKARGGYADDGAFAQYKKAAKGKTRAERREMLHAFANDYRYYGTKERKQKIHYNAYHSEPVKEVRKRHARANKDRRGNLFEGGMARRKMAPKRYRKLRTSRKRSS